MTGASLPVLAQVVIQKFKEGLRPGAGQRVLAPPAEEAPAEWKGRREDFREGREQR